MRRLLAIPTALLWAEAAWLRHEHSRTLDQLGMGHTDDDCERCRLQQPYDEAEAKLRQRYFALRSDTAPVRRGG